MPSGTAGVQTDLACAGRASIAQPRRQAVEVVFASGLVIESGISQKHPDHIPHRESFHGVSFPEKEPDHILIRPSFDRLSWALGRDFVTAAKPMGVRWQVVSHREPIRPSSGNVGNLRVPTSGVGPPWAETTCWSCRSRPTSGKA